MLYVKMRTGEDMQALMSLYIYHIYDIKNLGMLHNYALDKPTVYRLCTKSHL